MRRVTAVLCLALAAFTPLACRDATEGVAPRPRRAMEGNGVALAIEADAPVARLVVRIEDAYGEREFKVERQKGSLAAGALEVVPGEKTLLSFEAYDREGTRTHEGKGVLVAEEKLTAQQEFELEAVPGAAPAAVRIGSYRLALSQQAAWVEPGREVHLEAMLLDAYGNPHPIEKGTVELVQGEELPPIGDVRFDYRDWLLDIRWDPRDFIKGRVWFCHVVDLRTCGKFDLRDPNPVVQVSTGAQHSCALRKSGTVGCWGSNLNGELGVDLSGANHLARIRFASISAGGQHSCGIDDMGAVHCWGANIHGQLGRGFASPASVQPAQVALPAAARQVSAGARHTCALLEKGDTWCWGANSLGELGDGTGIMNPVSQPQPVQVAGGHAFTALSAGSDHTCGLTAQGEAWCWGSNDYGESGVARGMDEQCSYLKGPNSPVDDWWHPCLTSPHKTGTSLSFVGIAVGDDGSCAWSAQQYAYCWGHVLMQNPPPNNQAWVARTQASWQPHWQFFTAGTNVQCGLDTGGMVHCQGANHFGQTGTGSSTLTTYTMDPVALQDTWTGFDIGGFHGCGVRNNGYTVSCWGYNDQGQLGRPSTGTPQSLGPIDVRAAY